jgi:hypothetical protein
MTKRTDKKKPMTMAEAVEAHKMILSWGRQTTAKGQKPPDERVFPESRGD